MMEKNNNISVNTLNTLYAEGGGADPTVWIIMWKNL